MILDSRSAVDLVEGQLQRLRIVLQREAIAGRHQRIEREEVQIVQRRQTTAEQFVRAGGVAILAVSNAVSRYLRTIHSGGSSPSRSE